MSTRRVAVIVIKIVVGFGIAILGLLSLGIAFLFGTGTGLFGDQNSWGYKETVFAVFGCAMFVFVALSPLTRTAHYVAFISVCIAMMIAMNFQMDVTPLLGGAMVVVTLAFVAVNSLYVQAGTKK